MSFSQFLSLLPLYHTHPPPPSLFLSLKDRCQCERLMNIVLLLYYFLSTSVCLSCVIPDSCRCSLERLSIWEMAFTLIPFQILLKWASCLAFHTLDCLIISTYPRRVFSACTLTTMKEVGNERLGLTEGCFDFFSFFKSLILFIH